VHEEQKLTWNSPAPPVPEPAPIYTQLRSAILSLVPSAAGLTPSAKVPHVWGLLMETGYPQAAVTLVALCDGTTSLYFGRGGGFLGAGNLPAVARASRALIAAAEHHWPRLAPATSFPLPAVGWVRFTVLTFAGAFSAEAEEELLGAGRHELSPLYCRGQDVISKIRLNSAHQ
jgi:hypothetical protein